MHPTDVGWHKFPIKFDIKEILKMSFFLFFLKKREIKSLKIIKPQGLLEFLSTFCHWDQRNDNRNRSSEVGFAL